MKLKKPFILWHAGLLITLVSLVFYGHNEGMIRLYPFSDSFGPAVFYGLRLLGGCLMLTASLIWFEKIIFCRWALGLHNLRARHTKE